MCLSPWNVTVNRARRRPLMGIELVHVPDLAEGPPHLLDDLHVFERRLERLGGGMHRIHRCVTSTLGGGSRRLRGLPEVLALLPDSLQRLTMLVTEFTCFLGQLSELFRLKPDGFR